MIVDDECFTEEQVATYPFRIVLPFDRERLHSLLTDSGQRGRLMWSVKEIPVEPNRPFVITRRYVVRFRDEKEAIMFKLTHG